jgi:hypothetical protein
MTPDIMLDICTEIDGQKDESAQVKERRRRAALGSHIQHTLWGICEMHHSVAQLPQ